MTEKTHSGLDGAAYHTLTTWRRMPVQWHPIFAHLLRPLLQGYYEVQTDVAVGDLPRQADVVLLRQLVPAPFIGIWRYLTPWNVLEFKGPTDDPGLRDLDLLLEVGLGIDRRLNEQRQQRGETALPRADVSWWYLANHVGRRFRSEAERLFGQPPVALGEGLWHCPALGHPLFLVSRDVLPVERESVPLHLVSQESLEREQALAREVAQQPGFWELYGPWLAYLHPDVWEEVQQMIRSLGTEPTLDLRPLIDLVGLKQVIGQIGLKQVISEVGLKQVISEVGLKQVISEVGLKQVISEVGLKAAMDTATFDEIVVALGLERLLSGLTPEQAQELKRRLS
jgi:hypothetical protein